MRPLVLDTNVVLDLLVFADEAAQPLMRALQEQRLEWFATPAMREELARVLCYPKLARRIAFHGREAAAVLAAFDHHARQVEPAPRAPLVCKDPDDQKFIDLAVARGGLLLSKDAQVLKLRKRLAAHSVWAAATLES